LPDPACHETTYYSGFQLFGLLVYAVPLCGRFFGFDDDLRLAGHHLRRVLDDDAARQLTDGASQSKSSVKTGLALTFRSLGK
jgi:hypothetical protein